MGKLLRAARTFKRILAHENAPGVEEGGGFDGGTGANTNLPTERTNARKIGAGKPNPCEPRMLDDSGAGGTLLAKGRIAKMKRRLFNLAAILSLLLCLGTGLLWGRSYWRSVVIGSTDAVLQNGLRSYVDWDLFVGYGQITWTAQEIRTNGEIINVSDHEPGERRFEGSRKLSSRTTLGGFLHSLIEFSLQYRDPNPIMLFAPNIKASSSSTFIAIPLWPVALLFAILPTRWAILKRREMKLKKLGCCKKCGYDLRATPERCPECGTEVSGRTAV